MDMLIFVFDGVAIAHEAAAIATLDNHLMPIIEIPSSFKAQNPLQESYVRRPVDGRPRIYEILLRDELITLMKTSREIFLHTPSKIYLLPEDEQFVGNNIKIYRIRRVCVNGVRRAIHAHRPCFDVELHLPEEVYTLHSEQQ